MSSSRLFTIPREVTHKILEHLDFRSLLICRVVCHTLKSSVDTSSVLQYEVKLAAAGVVAAPRAGGSASQRLMQLQAYNEAWVNGAWQEHTQASMPRAPLWELYGCISASGNGSRLAFKQLPSPLRGIEARQWELDFDFDVRDFGLDSSQDLLVVVEKITDGPYLCRIHLRQLLTGQKHPEAQTSSGLLPHDRPVEDAARREWSYSIRVSGRYVGILFLNNTFRLSELYVWDWKTGRLYLNIIADEVRSYTFLGAKYVLVATLPLGHDDTSLGVPSLFIFDLSVPEPRSLNMDEVSELPSVWSFELPSLPHITWDLNISCDPSPSWTYPHHQEVPFYTAPNDRLIAIEIQLLVGGAFLRSHTLLIHSLALLSRIPQSAQSTRRDPVPWDTWSPRATRNQPNHGHWSNWTCFVFGMRYVFPHPVVRDGVRMVQLWDFHPLRVRRATSGADGSVLLGETQQLPSVLREIPLPSELQKPCTLDFMISEDTILAIESDVPSGVERSMHLFTF